MAKNRPSTKILVDGGDPEETARIRNLLGFLDGQTTNPTLVAKNPEVQQRIASGHKLSRTLQQRHKYLSRMLLETDASAIAIELASGLIQFESSKPNRGSPQICVHVNRFAAV